MASPNTSRRRNDWLPRLAALGVLAAVVGLAINFWPQGESLKTFRTVQSITVVTPPPPPPPEPEEKIMEEEPEIIEPANEPEVQKDVASPDEPSEAPSTPDAGGLDRPADTGADSFRLSAGRGGNLFGSGGGGGGGGWGPFVETHIRRALQRDPRTRVADGYLKVALVIDPTGRVTDARLLSSTGDAKLDAAVRDVLTKLPPLSRSRPSNVAADTVATINMKRLAG